MDTNATTDGWELRAEIDPEPLRKAAAERAAQKQEEAAQRNAEWDRKETEARRKAEGQVDLFRRRLGELLGTEVPADAITVSRTYPGYETTCRLLQIEEKRDYLYDDRVLTGRDLIAVWTDETIHIRVCGEEITRRWSSMSPDTAKTWDAGPVTTAQDLLRIIEQRGNTRWTPPTGPEPEQKPEPVVPTAAERAQTLLERLSTNPRNHRGLRGALIALSWSNLATRQD